MERKKPKFLRKDWNKKIKLGSKVKKNRKWRGAKGIHNKTRLGKAGYAKRPKVGWGADKKIKNLVEGESVVRVENLAQLNDVKVKSIILASVGKKKRLELKKVADEKGIKILNKYRNKNESN